MLDAVKDQVTGSILLYLYEKYTAERSLVLSNVFGIRTVLALTDPMGWRYSTTAGVVERQCT